MASDTPINFVLDSFSSSYTMLTQGYIDDPVGSVLDVSATAVLYMSANSLREIFKFHTDGEDFNDLASQDILYFTFMDKWNEALGHDWNPVNAMMDQPSSNNAIQNISDSAKNLVKHDFIRYIALRLFNSPKGVDLFSNEAQMLSSLNTMGDYVYNNIIYAHLWRYSTTSTYTTDNPMDPSASFIIDSMSGLKCTTDNLDMLNNIPRNIMNAMLMKSPTRFQNVVLDASGIAPIPFIVGDSIIFKFLIYPATNQHLLTGVQPLDGRSYQIKIVVTNGTVQNTTVDNTTKIDGLNYATLKVA